MEGAVNSITPGGHVNSSVNQIHVKKVRKKCEFRYPRGICFAWEKDRQCIPGEKCRFCHPTFKSDFLGVPQKKPLTQYHQPNQTQHQTENKRDQIIPQTNRVEQNPSPHQKMIPPAPFLPLNQMFQNPFFLPPQNHHMQHVSNQPIRKQ